MSEYLFARPSFLSGAARVFDLGGTFDFYNISPSGQVANARGIWSDWLAVRRYFKDAVEEFKDEFEREEAQKK
jgi:hypothetical protein